MDYMDPDVHCFRKVVKINQSIILSHHSHSLTHSAITLTIDDLSSIDPYKQLAEKNESKYTFFQENIFQNVRYFVLVVPWIRSLAPH